MATPRLTAFLGSGPPARLRLASAHCRLNEPVFVEEEGLPEPSKEAVSKSVVAPTGDRQFESPSRQQGVSNELFPAVIVVDQARFLDQWRGGSDHRIDKDRCPSCRSHGRVPLEASVSRNTAPRARLLDRPRFREIRPSGPRARNASSRRYICLRPTPISPVASATDRRPSAISINTRRRVSSLRLIVPSSHATSTSPMPTVERNISIGELGDVSIDRN
jgi:hypothetical protein